MIQIKIENKKEKSFGDLKPGDIFTINRSHFLIKSDEGTLGSTGKGFSLINYSMYEILNSQPVFEYYGTLTLSKSEIN